MKTELDQTLRGASVLVSGGHGFIGGPLSARLAALGARVTTVSRSAGPERPGIHQRCVDLADANATAALIRASKPDFVFHLASHVLGKRSVDVVQSTLASNLLSTVNLLQSASEHDCQRVILTGSMEEPEPSTQWAVPSSPYAAAKAAASSYGRMFHALFALPVVILRVFMVYGPGQHDRSKLIPYVIQSLLQGESPNLSSGTRAVDWVYIDDVVDAYLAAACQPNIEGKTIDVGSGALVTVGDIVKQLYQQISPKQTPNLGSSSDRAMEQERRADVEESFRQLGWRTTTPIESGLSRTVEWYRQNP